MSEPKVYRRMAPCAPAVDEGASMFFVPVEQIRPNRAQPRNRFDTNTMIRLADSVRRYGVLQPLTIRLSEKSAADGQNQPPYELISGERRLRAAKLAGLARVPCVLASADDNLSAELAIIENLLREDLDMFEQAKAFGRLILRFSMTQEQVARKMSMSQSAVANKLRLLRLNETEQKKILVGGLTERHARALLRLPADTTRASVIDTIIDRHMNVAATEEYIDALLSSPKARSNKTAHAAETAQEPVVEETPPLPAKPEEGEGARRKKLVLKDLRIFYNSLEHAVAILKQTGLAPQIEQREEGDRVIICISVDTPPVERSASNVSRETPEER